LENFAFKNTHYMEIFVSNGFIQVLLESRVFVKYGLKLNQWTG